MGQRTPLYDIHKTMGGKIVDFGGWDMPLHYGSQLEEHHQVRRAAGMFDVSHMTVVDISGPDAKAYLQYLLANDVARAEVLPGKALYSGLLNPQGGVIDDLIVYYLSPNNYRIISNCATREKDLAWMNQQAARYEVKLQERPDLAIIAVQGPSALELASKVLGEAAAAVIAGLKTFQGANSGEYFIARTGYTGEDGVEILLPGDQASRLWQSLADAGVAPCGLGARDTLRLEAGMNLYGHEMDEETSPLVANMGWTIAWEPAERNFIGRAALEAERQAGISHKLVGLLMRERGVLRAGLRLSSPGKTGEGIITSGTFSPTLGYSIALARVPSDFADRCQVDLRGKLLDLEIVRPNFVRHGKAVF